MGLIVVLRLEEERALRHSDEQGELADELGGRGSWEEGPYTGPGVHREKPGGHTHAGMVWSAGFAYTIVWLYFSQGLWAKREEAETQLRPHRVLGHRSPVRTKGLACARAGRTYG